MGSRMATGGGLRTGPGIRRVLYDIQPILRQIWRRGTEEGSSGIVVCYSIRAPGVVDSLNAERRWEPLELQRAPKRRTSVWQIQA